MGVEEEGLIFDKMRSSPLFSLRLYTFKMAATAASSLQINAARPSLLSAQRILRGGVANPGINPLGTSWAKFSSACHISFGQHFSRTFTSSPAKFNKVAAKAMSEPGENKPASGSGLPINLKGKRAFIAGVADDNGYGWAIAKSLAAAGAEILLGTWVPALNIFETSLRRGKFDESRVLPDGSLMEITKVYALDAVFDSPEDVPEDIKANKRYAGSSNWTVKEVAECVKQDFAALTFLFTHLLTGQRWFFNLSNIYCFREDHPRVLAFEAGRKHKVRVNTISAGPLRSRAAKAIGFIDMMIDYSLANAPLQKELSADEVGNTAAFLASPLASAITGAVIYVDNGLNAMGVGVDSPIFKDLDIPKAS
ncbi:Enoyl-[acyl-carrier-protein] reductase [NADH], chloroplastic [Sesamum angolense]|uniref:Enoyl-[acyl-carrier-protein] reductase [NADH], chloroplastic n=1 Tax=Sesamum angolense TaxID=2727404 RepID=A0AAE1X9F7_9LAMI|nr:Enoyl-[acyl-carrier-protein] reductase [NADH], chloroplastic [Sesamum angolense]